MESKRTFSQLQLRTFTLIVIVLGIFMGLNMSSRLNDRLWCDVDNHFLTGFGFPFIAISVNAGTWCFHMQALYCDAVLLCAAMLLVVTLSESWVRKFFETFRTSTRTPLLGGLLVVIGLLCVPVALWRISSYQNFLFFGLHYREVSALTVIASGFILTGVLLIFARRRRSSWIFLTGTLLLIAGALALPFYGLRTWDLFAFIDANMDSTTQDDVDEALSAVNAAILMHVVPFLLCGTAALIVGCLSQKPASDAKVLTQ